MENKIFKIGNKVTHPARPGQIGKVIAKVGIRYLVEWTVRPYRQYHDPKYLTKVSRVPLDRVADAAIVVLLLSLGFFGAVKLLGY